MEGEKGKVEMFVWYHFVIMHFFVTLVFTISRIVFLALNSPTVCTALMTELHIYLSAL